MKHGAFVGPFDLEDDMTPEEAEDRARLIVDWLDANPHLSRALHVKGVAIELQRAHHEGACLAACTCQRTAAATDA